MNPLNAYESGDIEQVGFRVVETIRRHPALARWCRPIVCTDEMTDANARYADVIGAYAIVDTTWAQVAHRQVLAELIEWAIAQPAGELRLHRRRARVVPSEAADEHDEEREQAAHFRAWFGFEPSDLHLALLCGMANAVELEFLKEYLADELGKTPRIAKRQLERLQQAMATEVEAMDRPETARAEFARRFIAEALPPHPDPFPELNWPMLAHVRNIWQSDREIVHEAFLEPGGLDVVDAFFDALEIPEGGGARERHAAISTAVERTAVCRDLPIATAHWIAHRSLHALDDARADRRLHGNGVASYPEREQRDPLHAPSRLRICTAGRSPLQMTSTGDSGSRRR